MMIKIIRQGDNYIYPWFEEELRLISPNLSVIWDKENEHFLIVSSGPTNVFAKILVVEYAVTDEDGQFVPLDRIVLEAIAELNYKKQRDISVGNGKQSLAPLIKKIKQSRIEKRERAFRRYLEMKGDFYKKWNKLWKTKTIDLGGKIERN